MVRMKAAPFMHLQVFECFASFQGEGLGVGKAQAFLRLAGCNLSCRYCDTPGARVVPATARLETSPFRGSFQEAPNPLPAGELAGWLRSNLQPGMDSISLTGGEPLLQAEGLAALLDELGPGRLPVHLETNATLPEKLELLESRVETACLDVKLESVAGCGRQLEKHLACLALCRTGRAFLKVVLSEGYDPVELEEAALELGSLGRARALVLQPVTPVDGSVSRPAPASLWRAYRICSRYFEEVRVIPQAHRCMGVP